MLIQFSRLQSKPFYCLETKTVLGKIKDLICDPKNGQILAFEIFTLPLSGRRFISTRDVLETNPNYLIVAKESCRIKAEDVLALKKIVDSGIKVLDALAKNKKGEWLGRIDDLLIDSQTLSIIKFYLRGATIGFSDKPVISLKQNSIIPAEDLIKITLEAVIFKNQIQGTEKVKKATAPELA
ncbi:MAG TPA: hypothetical protein VJJ80_00590 [Patescibacteria group bacterium]|nr:hypothetical protein [Patescibacteria group bacterium]